MDNSTEHDDHTDYTNDTVHAINDVEFYPCIWMFWFWGLFLHELPYSTHIISIEQEFQIKF